MKWFKFYCGAQRTLQQVNLFNEFGHKGVMVYYLILSLCAEQLEKPKVGKLNESDCNFEFNLKYLVRELKVSERYFSNFSSKADQLLNISIEIVSKNVKIKAPILLESLDSDFKSTRSKRVSNAFETLPDGMALHKHKHSMRESAREDEQTLINNFKHPALKLEQRFSSDFIAMQDELKELGIFSSKIESALLSLANGFWKNNLEGWQKWLDQVVVKAQAVGKDESHVRAIVTKAILDEGEAEITKELSR